MCCGARMPANAVTPLAGAVPYTGSSTGGQWEVTVPGEDGVRLVNSEVEAVTLTANGGGLRRVR